MSISRPTLVQVAAKAGVSKMTASRALRGGKDVSKDSLRRVQTAAKQIGYTGNPLATSLSSKRSNLIGVVVPSLGNSVFAKVLAGIAEGIKDSPLQPVYGVTEYDPEAEYEVIRNILSWAPAGMIVTGLEQPPETRKLLAQAQAPVVQIMDSDGPPIDACVGLSHQAAGADMAAALLAAGHRKIAYAGCGLDRNTRAQKRLMGFTAALDARGLTLVDTRIAPGPSTVQQGRAMTADLLTHHPDVDCLYFSNDDLALGAAFECLSRGIDTENELKLAGFNGLEILSSFPLRIATTPTPLHEIGRRATEILTGGDDGPRQVVFTPSPVL